MEYAKHTPGPWLNRTQHFGASGVGTPYVSAGDTAMVLCYMNLSGAYGGNKDVDRANADARLIAAAPELLAALKRSEQYLILAVHDNKGDLRAIAENDLGLVRAAISKATQP